MVSENIFAQLGKQLTSYVLVDLDAIASNIRNITAHIGPSVEMFAVVKAHAYGHGAMQVARLAVEIGVPRLAVGRTDEGVQLRQAGISVPILNLCYTLPAEAESIVVNDLTATVNTIEGVAALSSRAGALGKLARIHIKIDTGMGRYGLLPDEVLPFLAQVSAYPHLDMEGIFTHFSVADSADKTYTQQQFAEFQSVLRMVEKAGYHFRVRHAANSAAMLNMPDMHLDAVRPGLALYGMYPSEEVPRDVQLTPALSLSSHVARVRTLSAGSSIGYGRTFITDVPTRIALIPLGYGDGYSRAHSNKGVVLINGQRAPIVGRVCMDQFMVDARNIADVKQDDHVVLIGAQGKETLTVEELASVAGTINYEVVTALARRIPRVYIQGGQVVEISHLKA